MSEPPPGYKWVWTEGSDTPDWCVPVDDAIKISRDGPVAKGVRVGDEYFPTLPPTPTPEMIEAMARVICAVAGFDPDERIDANVESDSARWQYYVVAAMKAYAALYQHLTKSNTEKADS